jgi:hypothetical protein
MRNRYEEGKQMTATAKTLLGASSTVTNWDAIKWRAIERQVKRLQMRIAKATREGRWGKVKSLQWLLTHAFSAIDDGFDFLGFNVRKYNGKLLTKPSKSGVKRFLDDIRELIKKNCAATTKGSIHQLNNKLRGWANYYRHVVSKRTFAYVDHQIFLALIAWINRRHPNKSAQWKRQRYFRREGLRQWVFFAAIRDELGPGAHLDLFAVASVPIIRHIKIRARNRPWLLDSGRILRTYARPPLNIGPHFLRIAILAPITV